MVSRTTWSETKQQYPNGVPNTTQPDLQTLKRITELLEVNIQDLINFS